MIWVRLAFHSITAVAGMYFIARGVYYMFFSEDDTKGYAVAAFGGVLLLIAESRLERLSEEVGL